MTATCLKAISDYAKTADFGIEEMQFEVENKEIENDFEFPEDIPVEIKAALTSFCTGIIWKHRIIRKVN